MEISRRELLMLLSKGLVGSLALPFLSCSDHNSIINPQDTDIKILSDNQIKFAKEYIDGFFDYNLSGNRINPSYKSLKKGSALSYQNECGYDWILVVTRYEFQSIYVKDDYFITKILLEVQGIVQGYEWRAYKPQRKGNKLLIFKLKTSDDGKYSIINPLPPICFPNSVINHLRNVQRINNIETISPEIKILKIDEKIKIINNIMETLL